MIEIKKLPTKRWQEYKKLRLEALKQDPTAFGSSYSEDAKLPDKEWKKRINNALIALDKDQPIGMIVHIQLDKIKTRHIANIFGVYLNKMYRGKGIGKALFESALNEIKKNKKVIKISLNVNPKHKSALKMYKSFGFKHVGTLKKDLYINGEYHDEFIMEKML